MPHTEAASCDRSVSQPAVPSGGGSGVAAALDSRVDVQATEHGSRPTRHELNSRPFQLLLGALLLASCERSVDTSWHSEDGYRWRALDVPRRGSPGFALLDSSSTGVRFVNSVPDSLLLRNRILAQGGGVCLGDIDGDGLADIFLARTDGPNALYLNRGGWRFQDVTRRAGVAAADRYSTGCSFADVNGDEHLDLVLAALGGPNAVFANDGTGRFTEQLLPADNPSAPGSTTVALADVDDDGWLDLYITNYKAYTMLDSISPQERSFDQVVQQVSGGKLEVRERYRKDFELVSRAELGGVSLVQRADPDFFYRNDGTGRFVLERIGRNPRFIGSDGKPLTRDPEDFGLAAMFADLNNDGAPDLYVANDFEDPDFIWSNDGRGRFRMVPWHAVRSTSNSGMAVDVADVNRDGWPDVFQVDMLSRDSRRLKTQIPTHSALPKLPGQIELRPQMQRNTLQLNRGDGTFAEVARLAGVGASGWSWSTVFLDVDLDGWEDLLVGTGHRWDVMDGDTQHRLRDRLQQIDWRRMLFEYPPLPLPNVAFRNRHDLSFEDASKGWGFDLGDDISHGMAVADLDGDGDQDVVINRLDKPAAVLRNNVTAPRIMVRLKGVTPNTYGVGSKIRILGGAVPQQEREVVAGGLYLSGSEPAITFATGRADSVTIEVLWRNGARSVVGGARPNRLYEIDQGSASKPVLNATAAEPVERNTDSALSSAPFPSTAAAPLFEDVSTQLGNHQHVDPFFDDFSRQLLLPNSLSQLGPGVSWFDTDGDGREELIIGAGRNGTLALFRNDRGRLTRAPQNFGTAHTDLTTIVGWPDAHGGRNLMAGVSSYEMPNLRNALAVPSVIGYSTRTGAMTRLVPGDTGSVGPVALSDYDADGDLDVFVGSRVVPDAYPHASRSRMYRNDANRLVFDDINNALFAHLGMVSAATFADIDGNGWPDLIAAVEWGEIRVFLNDAGRLRAATNLPGLSGVTSRWNGVATGDLDGDGRLDLVATSWGRNSETPVSSERPLYLYRLATARGPDALLAQYDPRIKGVAPLVTFGRLGLAHPAATMRLRTYSAFSDASIGLVLGPANANAPRLQITTLDHMSFLNRGDHFEARPLPVEAQLSPAFYAGVADFTGDGIEDVILSQNFFATDIATPRYDAGRGLLLEGRSDGEIQAVPGQRSGLLVYGEQRGAAYADFDGDGRLDLVISQNAAATRLFRNVGAAPGLRVRLIGPPGNPDGVGAQVRVRYGDRAGPVREIQAGSGYWSQNGAVQVLGRSGQPTAVWVRWPGGLEQTTPITPGQSEIVVRFSR